MDVDDIFSVSKTAYMELQINFILSFTVFMGSFWILFILLKLFIKPKFFTEKKNVKLQFELVVYINANLHHALACSVAFYTVLFQCDRPFAMFYED